jgi:aarF domain-containing kinase
MAVDGAITLLLALTVLALFVVPLLVDPGNILVGEVPGKPGKLRLHLLDCGLILEMGPKQHINMVKILGAFIRKKGRVAGQLMVDTSSNCQASDLDMDLFISGIQKIVEDDEDNNFLEKVGDYITGK